MTPDDRAEGAEPDAGDGDARRTLTHQIRNALHGAKLQLALLEYELQGVAVSSGARRAVAAVRLQIDQMARLTGELALELREDG